MLLVGRSTLTWHRGGCGFRALPDFGSEAEGMCFLFQMLLPSLSEEGLGLCFRLCVCVCVCVCVLVIRLGVGV